MSRQTKKDNKINNRELIPDDAIKDTEDSQGFEVDWELVEKKYRQKYMQESHHHHSKSRHSSHHHSVSSNSNSKKKKRKRS